MPSKQAVDAWVDASSGAEEAIRYANAESVRWLEWGFQSYFRVLFGLSLLLFGVAMVAGRLVDRWLGWMAVRAGLLSLAFGIDVGYSGLQSRFQDAVGIAFQLVVLVFVVGMFVTGLRRRDPRSAVE